MEPGFFYHRSHMPLGPRVATEGLFEQHAGPLVDALGGGDTVLATQQTTIAGNVPDGFDARFTSTVGAAEDLAANQGGLVDDQAANALVDAGAGVDAHRHATAPFLPPPSAPIEGNFLELPIPPGGHPGGGAPPPQGDHGRE